MELLHQSNIIIHVLTGTVALVFGLIALLSLKGGKIHNRSGRIFLMFIVVVVLTALIGVFVFKRNSFLLLITILSAYVAFSGYRTLKTKSNQAKKLDIIVSILSLLILAYFLYYFKSIDMYWSPIVIYSTVGAQIVIIAYDFFRYLISREFYIKKKFWIYEHIYKMTSAFTAILSAFSGTVFEQYQPHSQYLPSVFGTLAIFAFMIYFSKYGLKIWRV